MPCPFDMGMSAAASPSAPSAPAQASAAPAAPQAAPSTPSAPASTGAPAAKPGILQTMKQAVMGKPAPSAAPEADTLRADAGFTEPEANVDPGTDDTGDVSDKAPEVSDDTPPEWTEEHFQLHSKMFGLGEAQAAETPPAAGSAQAVAAGESPGTAKPATETPADPFAEIEKGLDVADLATALNYDPETDKDDPQFKAVSAYVEKQNKQTKALVGIVREQHKAMQQLQQVASGYQKQQDLALTMQAHAAADYVAKAHPFFAKQMGLYATGKASKEQLAVRNEVIKKAASLVADGKTDNLAQAIEAVAYGKWAKFRARVDNAQAKTPPPGGSGSARREAKTMREAVLGR